MVSRPPFRPLAALLVAAAVTAGCTGASSSESSSVGTTPVSALPSATDATTSPTPTAGPATSAATSAATTAAATTQAATPSAKATQARPVVVLEPDGLGFVVGEASIRHLRFGEADATAITTALQAALGGPLTVNALPECGQGPRKSVQRAGFSALLDGTKFVGWTDQGAAGRHLTTADGIGIGSTLGSVKAAMTGVTTANDTLGPEFSTTSGFGGMLTGLTSAGTVTLTYAGETCFFR